MTIVVPRSLAAVTAAILITATTTAQGCTGPTNISLEIGNPRIAYAPTIWRDEPALVVTIFGADWDASFVKFSDFRVYPTGACNDHLTLEAVGAIDTRPCSAGAPVYLQYDDLLTYTALNMHLTTGAPSVRQLSLPIGYSINHPLPSPTFQSWSFNYSGVIYPGPCGVNPPLGPELLVAVFTVQRNQP